jgi:hypothetical protein
MMAEKVRREKRSALEISSRQMDSKEEKGGI